MVNILNSLYATPKMKHDYRYRLGKIVSRCPQCHRRTFKPYIDVRTGRPLAADVCGRCNREVKCAYHVTPHEYMATHFVKPSLYLHQPPAVPEKPSFLDFKVPEDSDSKLTQDTLFVWMHRLCGYDPAVRLAWQAYDVFHSSELGGSTAFPLYDRFGNLRSVKLMRYGHDGHRCKTGPQSRNFGFMHSRVPGFNYRPCFFGEHLAQAFPKAVICIVESEKTALLCSVYYGWGAGRVWVACGGRSAIRGSVEDTADPYFRLSFLKGREVFLYPDADSVEHWKESAGQLRRICDRVTVVDVQGISGSEDIGDMIVRYYEDRNSNER